jgi:pimeloyl-ACP methyl ester carboxylesterase
MCRVTTFPRDPAGRRWTTRLLTAAAMSGLILPVSMLAVSSAGASSASALVAPARPSSPAPAATRTVGTLKLRRCERSPLAYCGSVLVPLDYSSALSPDIRIGFRWLPATADARAAGTILAVEGGPGFASTGTEAEYVTQAGLLLRSRNMLLVNLRGTGNSTPVNCPALEKFGHVQAQDGPAFDQAVAACGNQLNHTWRYRDGGGWVHASDLFNTAYSARDVLRVMTALRTGRADLYGDSYGSWFAQVFASRYASHLRSVTLDSTYQVLGLDPWYTTTVVTARRAFDQACELSVACSEATAGRHGEGATGWGRIAQLATRLAARPVTGETTTEDGTRGKLTVTALTLVNLVNNAGFDPVVYRDLDAAGRALIQRDDPVPLLRIAALSLGFDDDNYPLPEYSDGLYFAVSCTDYVQLFSREATPATRLSQYQAALASEPARTFAPFSVAEWTSLDQYTEAYSACLNWPSPARTVPPVTAHPPLVPRSLPVLIMSGTLDSLTPRLDGATLVARQVGPSARLVTFANLTHVMLQDQNDACPASVYQAFLRHPGRLHQLNVSCAARVTPVHTVGSYPRTLATTIPATARPGNTAGRQALRAAATGVASVGDEISRYPLLSGDIDRGLRGGTVTFSGGDVLRIALRNVRWVSDATINGTAWWNQSSGRVTARLTIRPARGPVVRLIARWRAYGAQDQLAVITGSQGIRRLTADGAAP